MSEVAGLESISLILLKAESSAEVFLHGFHKIAFFKFQKIFCNIYVCHFYSDKVAGLPAIGFNINENKVLDKNT